MKMQVSWTQEREEVTLEKSKFLLFGALDLLRVYPAVHTGTDIFSGPAALLRVLAGGWARVPAWNQAFLLPLVLVSWP